jgi:hypothetical protein
MVKDWSRALLLLLMLALLLPLLLPALLPEINALFIASVDVWTDKGGQGIGNINGGRYNIGESITFYCFVNINVDSLTIRVINPVGMTELTVLERGPSPAGTYQASLSVGRIDGIWRGGIWRVICEVRSGGQSLSDEVLFGVAFIAVNPVDVWTNKGGQGNMDPDGGQYAVGESITLYCKIEFPARFLQIVLIKPDGSQVVVLDRLDAQAGTYSVSGIVGEPTGVRIVSCFALPTGGDIAYSDEVGYAVQQRATATVTVYTTTTRTVTSTLHATATTETTTYITVYQTTSSTSTRTWYTTVTRTATTTVISWTTVTTTVLG